jgi:Cu-Zn family superoxide dismutase
MKPRIGFSLANVALLAVAACGGGAPAPETPAGEPPPASATTSQPAPGEAAPETAPAAAAEDGPIEVQILAKSGSTLTGTAKFEDTPEGVKVTVRLGNAPSGLKGAHIHEKGDCSSDDGKSAGDHFNPGGHDHGRPPDEKRHLGDLGNIGVDTNGLGLLEIVVAGANLKAGDPNSFLGRAIIIHGKKDDGSQPAGNAGERIGCGVIKR